MENGYREYMPIIVNETMEIIEGQHRYVAAKELGLPIYYEVVPGLTMSDALEMNKNNAGWKRDNYVNYYAMEGNKNYERFVDMLYKYKEYGLGRSVVLCAAYGYVPKGTTINEGLLNITKEGERQAERVLDQIARFVPYKNLFAASSTKTYTALIKLIKNGFIDVERMLDQFEKHGRTQFIPRGNELGCVESLDILYNYRKTDKVHFVDMYRALKETVA